MTRVALPRRLRSLALVGAIVITWESVKALFGLPVYQLPHIHEILADFLRPVGADTLMFWVMAENAGYTALESLVASRWAGSPA